MSAHPAAGGRPIVVPIDPAVFSVGSLRLARSLAHETGASVHVVRVRSRSPSRLADARELYLDGIGAYFSSELGPHRVRTASLEGDSLVETLARYARELGASMVVLTGGRHSVGARVAEAAGVPVLLVHPRGGAAGADVELVGAPRPGATA